MWTPRGRGGQTERGALTHTDYHVEKSGKLRPSTVSSMLWGDLQGWDEGVGGGSRREGLYVHVQLIHVVLQQKLTRHGNTVILQPK